MHGAQRLGCVRSQQDFLQVVPRGYAFRRILGERRQDFLQLMLGG